MGTAGFSELTLVNLRGNMNVGCRRMEKMINKKKDMKTGDLEEEFMSFTTFSDDNSVRKDQH